MTLFKYALQLFVGLLLLNAFMYWQQPSMTFFPHTTITQTPQDWGLAYDDVYFESSDGVSLHGWFIPHSLPHLNDAGSKAENAGQKTLLFFHGNAGNISHRRSSIEIFHRLGLNVFIIDYRGYGNSEGKPDEQGVYLDARAAWFYLNQQRNIDANNIIIFGRSLGGAIAAHLAAELTAKFAAEALGEKTANQQLGALILESSFSSAKDVANAIFPVLSRLVFLRFDFNTVAHVSQVTAPVLVMHSPDDQIIPFSLGEKIYQAANQPKYFFTLQGGHNNGFIMSQPAYEQTLRAFIFPVTYPLATQ